MKVDVETAEVAFLRGATETLKRHRPTLLMEVFAPQMEPVLAILRPLGYERRSDDLGEKTMCLPTIGPSRSMGNQIQARSLSQCLDSLYLQRG
jgi:hypothetical protein